TAHGDPAHEALAPARTKRLGNGGTRGHGLGHQRLLSGRAAVVQIAVQAVRPILELLGERLRFGIGVRLSLGQGRFGALRAQDVVETLRRVLTLHRCVNWPVAEQDRNDQDQSEEARHRVDQQPFVLLHSCPPVETNSTWSKQVRPNRLGCCTTSRERLALTGSCKSPSDAAGMTAQRRRACYGNYAPPPSTGPTKFAV